MTPDYPRLVQRFVSMTSTTPIESEVANSTSQRALGVAALVMFVVLAVWGAWTKSDTYDEPMYIVSAYSYVATGDLSLNREHPPLSKYLIGLPLLALDIALPELYQIRPGIAFTFLFHQPNADAHTMLFLARLPMILLGLLLGLYVWRWARLGFGPVAGLVAVWLYATNPSIVAHTRIAANDFSVTVFSFAACFHVWRWLKTDSRASLGWGAITLGLAVGSKLTALALLPVIGIVVLVEAVRRRRIALVGQAFLALFAMVGVLWLLYGGEARSLADARKHVRFALSGENGVVFRYGTVEGENGKIAEPGWVEQGLEDVFGAETPIPMLSFMKGIDLQLDHASEGHPTYFWGEINRGGFWNFYIVLWLLKNAEGVSLLLAVALATWWWHRRSFAHEWMLMAYPVLLFVVFSRGNIQLGFKYVLPAIPFLLVFASRSFAAAIRGGAARMAALGAIVALSVVAEVLFHDRGDVSWRNWTPLVVSVIAVLVLLVRDRVTRTISVACTVLALWAIVASLARMPNGLIYFNEWAGGPENGPHYSVIGDDWGQDARALGLWMAANDIDHIAYDYYGTGDPEYWGITSTPTFARPGQPGPSDGWFAINVTTLKRFPENYAWLEDRTPDLVLEHTIQLYDMSAE